MEAMRKASRLRLETNFPVRVLRKQWRVIPTTPRCELFFAISKLSHKRLLTMPVQNRDAGWALLGYQSP